MKLVAKIMLAAVLATSFAVPAMAGEWIYHGGPKSPDSLSWYEPDAFGYYGSGPYAPAYEGHSYGPSAYGY